MPCHELLLRSKLSRCAIVSSFEGPVEVGQVIEAAYEAYLRNVLVSFEDQTCCVAYSHIGQIIREGSLCPFLEEMTKGSLGHVYKVGYLFYFNIVNEVFLKIINHFAYSLAVDSIELPYISLGCQYFLIS